MNLSAQNPVSNGPFVAAESGSIEAGNKSGITLGLPDNLLNEKKFSDFLVVEEEQLTKLLNVPQTLGLTTDESCCDQALTNFSVSTEPMPIFNGGNSLPDETASLPPFLPLSLSIEDVATDSQAASLSLAPEQLSVAADVSFSAPEGDAETLLLSTAALPVASVPVSQPGPVALADSTELVVNTNDVLTKSQQQLSRLATGKVLGGAKAQDSEPVAAEAVTAVKNNKGVVSQEVLVAVSAKQALSRTAQGSFDISSVGQPVDDNSGVSPSVSRPAVAVPQLYRQPESTVLQTAVSVEVGKPSWSEAVTQRVMWMSSRNISQAEIALDPPELGPLQVRISTHADQTSITFTSHHGVVREALDQGLPKLREMMEREGLDLANVDVSDQNSGRQGRANQDSLDNERSTAAMAERAVEVAEEQGLLGQSASTDHSRYKLSLVDQYV